MPTQDNQIDPVTRAELELLGAYPAEHWTNLYDHLVRLGAADPASLTTFMAHMTHAEIRYMSLFFIGQDVHAYLAVQERSNSVPTKEEA